MGAAEPRAAGAPQRALARVGALALREPRADTWAQNRETGEQGLTSVEYEEGAEDVSLTIDASVGRGALTDDETEECEAKLASAIEEAYPRAKVSVSIVDGCDDSIDVTYFDRGDRSDIEWAIKKLAEKVYAECNGPAEDGEAAS